MSQDVISLSKGLQETQTGKLQIPAKLKGLLQPLSSHIDEHDQY